MLIPSIDLMGGKIVQLQGGEKKALEFSDMEPWIEKFSSYPVVQVIDLDAAMRQGENTELVKKLCSRLRCQVGGGIRSIQHAKDTIKAGARQVLVGSALLRNGKPDTEFAGNLALAVGLDRLLFAVDSRDGKVRVSGWKETTNLTPQEVMRALDQFTSGFFYTHIDTEGSMQGFPIEVAKDLRKQTRKKLIVAGGIKEKSEIDELQKLGIDAVVGMAIYAGKMAA